MAQRCENEKARRRVIVSTGTSAEFRRIIGSDAFLRNVVLADESSIDLRSVPEFWNANGQLIAASALTPRAHYTRKADCPATITGRFVVVDPRRVRITSLRRSNDTAYVLGETTSTDGMRTVMESYILTGFARLPRTQEYRAVAVVSNE